MAEKSRAADSGGRPPPMRVGVLLPTLNEEEGLARTLEELPLDHLRATGYDLTVVVVDGHSTDRTVEVARSFGATVIEQAGRGKGAAMREGLAWASEQGIEAVAVLDADFTYPANGIAPIFTLLAGGSDLVIGVRRPESVPTHSPRDLVHRLGNGMLNTLAAQLSRHPVLDVCSGLWGVRTASIAGLRLVSDGFEIEAELFLKAFRAGLKVSQIPIAYRDRVGTAKLSAGRDGARIALAIFRHAPGRRIVRASPRSGPPAPSSASIREVEALVLATGAKNLLVYSDPTREEEARGLVRSLRAAQLGAEVVVRSTRSGGITESGLSPSGGRDPSDGPFAPSILVALPAADAEEEPVTVVDLPRTQRMVWVGGDAPPSLPKARMIERSGGYRLNRSYSRGLRPLALINASLDPSPKVRELALIGANESSRRTRVYEYVAPGKEAAVRPPPMDSPPGIDPVAP